MIHRPALKTTVGNRPFVVLTAVATLVIAQTLTAGDSAIYIAFMVMIEVLAFAVSVVVVYRQNAAAHVANDVARIARSANTAGRPARRQRAA